MKLNLFFSTAFAVISSINTFGQQVDTNGYSEVDIEAQPGYAERVFFNFSNGQTINKSALNWDIAFYRASIFEVGTRINDSNSWNVYEVSKNPDDWDNITNPNTAIASKNGLTNPDTATELHKGAFDQVEWGKYDFATHHYKGKSIFILAKGRPTAFYKFMIEDRFKNYKIKYALWNKDTSSWEETETATIPDGNGNTLFNYFSLKNNKIVADNEPNKTDWDIVFTQYLDSRQRNYLVFGVLQGPSISVAKKTDEKQAVATFSKPNNNDYSKVISTIGRDWKSYDPDTGGFSVDENFVYYIKKDKAYYRMYFTRATGNQDGFFRFKYKNVTDVLAVKEVGSKANFGVYPNPTVDKKATILFEVKDKADNNGSAELYDFSGKKVYETTLQNQSGLYQKDINLQGLPSGTYLLKISFGGATETRKLILK